MKKVFKKSYLLQNGGCYTDKKMIKLTAPRENDDDIFIHEILDSQIPLVDKFYFVFKHCDLKKQKIVESLIVIIETTLIHYTSIESKNDKLIEIMNLIIGSYLDSKRFKKEVMPHKETLRDIGLNSINDTKYIAHGVYHLIDLIDIINNDEDFSFALDESYYTSKYLIKAMVSRPDLRGNLLIYLKKFTT